MQYFAFPTQIQFGRGALALLPDGLAVRGLRRPLVVTDKGLTQLPPVARTVDLLTNVHRAPTVFADIWGNPVASMVAAGVVAFRAAEADAIVAIGGGAAMDVAKAIALMVHHPGDLFDYEDGKPDARPIDQPIPPIVTIPTTAGTGSEVGRAAVIAEDESHVKRILFHQRLLAELVLIDPELTVDLPAGITAATGLDALTHLVEAYLAQGYHPMCDGIALEGIRIVANHLVDAVRFAEAGAGPTPEHLAARGAMMNAAMMGAVAFQKGLGVNHSCAHALSTACDLHHGLANGILIPYAMAFNAEAVPERFTTMAQAAGLDTPSPERFLQWLSSLQREVNVPPTLVEVGVRPDQMDELVRLAHADTCHLLNPRPVSPDDIRRIFSEALGA